jgi:hypothetical protein
MRTNALSSKANAKKNKKQTHVLEIVRTLDMPNNIFEVATFDFDEHAINCARKWKPHTRS